MRRAFPRQVQRSRRSTKAGGRRASDTPDPAQRCALRAHRPREGGDIATRISTRCHRYRQVQPIRGSIDRAADDAIAGRLSRVPRRGQGADRSRTHSCRTRRQQRADQALLGDWARDSRPRAARGLGRQGHRPIGRGSPSRLPRDDRPLACQPPPHAPLRQRLARRECRRNCPTAR